MYSLGIWLVSGICVCVDTVHKGENDNNNIDKILPATLYYLGLNLVSKMALTSSFTGDWINFYLYRTFDTISNSQCGRHCALLVTQLKSLICNVCVWNVCMQFYQKSIAYHRICSQLDMICDIFKRAKKRVPLHLRVFNMLGG
jgi:hypothetical protein